MDIVFVTAFKDINRANWNIKSKRSLDTYITYFLMLAKNITYPLIVYVSDDIKTKILQSGNTFNSNITFLNYDNVDTFYNKYLERDREIMSSEKYKSKIPFHKKKNPEHLYSEYNLATHNKTNFLKNALMKYPDYIYYAWIDFGYVRKISSVPKDINVSKLKSNITMHCLDTLPANKLSAEDLVKSNNVYTTGGTFIVHKNYIGLLEKIYEKKLNQMYDNYITDDDQTVFTQLYFDYPSIFTLYTNPSWFSLYLLI
jgi:hypothetical protein